MNLTKPLLLLSHDPLRVQVLAELLSELGYSSAVYSRGSEGLEQLQQQDYALVLVDMKLEDMDQLSCIRRIATLSANADVQHQHGSAPQTSVEDTSVANVPLLALSDEVLSANIPAALEAGAWDYLVFPCHREALALRISQALERKSYRQQRLDEAARDMLLKLERDVQIGRDIQQSFLPSDLPQPKGWQIATSFSPARDVAGDFYDSFYFWNKRRVAFLIADVSDKGVPAALFMAIFRTLLRAGALYQMNVSGEAELSIIDAQKHALIEEPGQRPKRLPTIGTTQLAGAVVGTNTYMAKTHGIDSYFVTLFMGVLDPRTGDLLYVNGGHNPPVIVRQDGSYDKLKATGPAVGILPEARYRYAYTRLQPGDTLYAYTDGVTEARAEDGGFFGEERLLPLLQHHRDDATMLLSSISQALAAYIGNAGQFDDITMMAVHRKAEEQPEEPDTSD